MFFAHEYTRLREVASVDKFRRAAAFDERIEKVVQAVSI
jgi:hypothetical protein